MRNKFFYFLYLLVCLAALFSFSCQKDEVDENAKVEFSKQAINFDTVFTTIGSTTQNFTVRNPHNFSISLNIDLAGGSQSLFSINVDGVAGHHFSSVEIAPHDSIFIHVKVNINPNDQNTPFIVTDSIIFRNGNSTQDVDLLAYGQNANFIVANAGSGALRYKIIAGAHETVTWTNDKPYVIYGGYAAVDSLGTLIIEPGTKIYFHSGAGLWIYRYGNIQATGTTDEPIVFRGDKLSSWYDTDYAQWDRIWINEGTRNNRFENVVITNAFIGLQVEALNERLSNETILKNCIIKNTHNSGILARNCKITAENCQISNNGGCGLQLQIGDFDLKHLTIANYFSQSVRKFPALYVSNTYSDGVHDYIGNTATTLTNCIVYGSMADEIIVYKYENEEVTMDTRMENCLIRHSQALDCFINCIRNSDPLFTNHAQQDFTLRTGSPAIDAGKLGLSIHTDLTGNARDANPDIGAYEYGSQRKFRY